MKSLKDLTPIQYHVTKENGTERPFDNAYFDHFEQGLYVDIISGKPLFSSVHKFESQCGWPSFFDILVPENIMTKVDPSHGMERVEVRSVHSDSHLGHVFTDGPKPTGLRYCINSAALDFIHLDDLAKYDLLEYKEIFNG